MFRATAVPLIFCLVALAGCAGVSPKHQRVWLDSSNHSQSSPDWVEDTRLVWEKDSKVFYHSVHTVRGDERVNGCYDLAKLDAREALLTEMATQIKGSIDNAQQSINENAEVLLGKVRTGEFEGRITGLRHKENYFERYKIGEVERVDCHVLSEISKKDYDSLKKSVVNRLEKLDPRLREAVTKKQVDFFEGQKPAGSGG